MQECVFSVQMEVVGVGLSDTQVESALNFCVPYPSSSCVRFIAQISQEKISHIIVYLLSKSNLEE
jgi:hypothetical protein